MRKYLAPFAVTAMLISSSSFAALNSYLQIKGSKGSSQIVSCPNGACTVPSLLADTYSVSIVDAQGKPTTVSDPVSCDVKSPRDAASGLPTGKRMHKPFVITKELSVSSVNIAQDETNLSITCTGTSVATPSSVTADTSAGVSTAKTATYDLKAAKK